MTSNEPWLSVEDVAKHLGAPRGSGYRWVEPRGLPAHIIGRLWTFKRSQVDTWAAAGGAESDGVEGGAQ